MEVWRRKAIPKANNSTVFDWAYLYYVGRTVLGLEEEEFWNSSVEKLNELVEVHGAVNDKKLAKKRQRKMAKNKSNSVGNVYIDQVGFL